MKGDVGGTSDYKETSWLSWTSRPKNPSASAATLDMVIRPIVHIPPDRPSSHAPLPSHQAMLKARPKKRARGVSQPVPPPLTSPPLRPPPVNYVIIYGCRCTLQLSNLVADPTRCACQCLLPFGFVDARCLGDTLRSAAHSCVRIDSSPTRCGLPLMC